MNRVKRLKTVIVEPSPIVGRGLESLLGEHPEFAVAKTYCDFHNFAENQSNYLFDLALINPVFVASNSEFSMRDLFPDDTQTVFVAILYKYVNPEIIGEFDGTLDIYNDGETIINKLLEVVDIRRNTRSRNSDENSELSDREKEILAAVAKGMTNKEIADKYCLSVHTVVSHRKNIAKKIGIKTVAGLTIYAIFNNLISQNDLL
ncbi:MAG: LuxR C-terminal-related transcriptional regulator [Prevotellaceae bacterium]|jgi:DNA-binding NarL/FixJ family response regulator|nr:LuxR C-terminal-related transcriptional regulator [Prevotellaceae bacterium]